VDEDERDAKGKEYEARLNAIYERVDRLYAFEHPLDRTLEDRVQDLERHVHNLRRLLVFVGLQGSASRVEAIERVERMLDEAEGRRSE
jgi:hypothetical protein